MTTMKMTLFGGAAVCAALFAQPALAQHDHAGHSHAPDRKQSEMTWTESYSLDTCPVSGEKLGSMGYPVVKTYDGREVRFCCDGCIKDFEADRNEFFKKIDKKMVMDQLPYYPMDTCIVGGDPLFEDGEDMAVNMVYGNRLVRFCCMDCKKEFKADPETFIEKLDIAVANAQREKYPLDNCIVSGEEVGSMSMGEPAEMVLAGRLIRFCCSGCEPKVKADPVKRLAEIDKAWQAKGMFMPTDDMPHADRDGGGHGDHDHGG